MSTVARSNVGRNWQAQYGAGRHDCGDYRAGDPQEMQDCGRIRDRPRRDHEENSWQVQAQRWWPRPQSADDWLANLACRRASRRANSWSRRLE